MTEPDAPVLAVCGLAFEAAIARGPGVIALHGPGSAALARMDARGCRGIVSFGIAGGLDPGLAPGDCVLAEAVIDGDECFACDARWLQSLSTCLPDAVVGKLEGVSSPVAGAKAKHALWQRSGACAVDMESHLAAMAARRYGLPFAALRVVADPAHRTLPACAIDAMRADGRVALAPLLRALAANPAELPLLALLAADAWAARRSLRAARCRAGAALRLP